MENFTDNRDIIATISRMEADLLRIMRMYDFAEFTIESTDKPGRRMRIVRKNGSPTKVVIEVSMSLNPEGGKRLADAVLVTQDTGTAESLIKSMINKVRQSQSGNN